MGDKQQPTFDFSKLNFDLSGGGAGGFNLQGALQGLQSQLGALGMIGADSGYFQTLPKAVQRRVRALRNLDVRPISISISVFDFSFISQLAVSHNLFPRVGSVPILFFTTRTYDSLAL